MQDLKIVLAVAFTALLSNFAEAEKIQLPTVGLEMELPDGWQQLDSKQYFDAMKSVKIGDKTFQEKLAKLASMPAVNAAKYQELTDKLNPAIKIFVKPYGTIKSRNPVKLEELLLKLMGKSIPNLKVTDTPKPVSIGGRNSATATVSFELNANDVTYPVISRGWVIPLENYFLMIGASLHANEPADLLIETKAIESIRISID